MDIHDYLGVLRRGLVLIVLGALIGVFGGVVAAAMERPSYSATSRELLTNKTAGDLNISQPSVASYALVVSSGLVLQPVIDQLGLDTNVDDLARRVSVVAPPETVVIEITATASTPVEAQKIANTISSVFGEVVAEQLETTTDASSDAALPTAPVRIVNLEKAGLPSEPNPPSGSLRILVGGVLGLVLGLVLASLLEAVDRRVRSVRDVAQVTDVPVVGEIVNDRAVRSNPLVARTGSRAASSESFRALRAHLDILRSRADAHTFVVTATGRAQGSTTVVANLGIALANTGTSVVLVDAHVRSSALSELFGVHAASGLSDVLAGRLSLDSVVNTRMTGGVALLPAGTVVGNPSELLATPAMRAVLAELRERFDVVLIDTPTIAATTDAAVLGSFDAATLLVVEQNRATRPRLEKALGSLAAGGTVPQGIVLNRTADGWESPFHRTHATLASPPVVPVVQLSPALREPSSPVEPVSSPVEPVLPPVEPVETPEPVEAVETPEPVEALEPAEASDSFEAPRSDFTPFSSPIPAGLLPEGQVELPFGRGASDLFAARPTPTAAEQRAGAELTSRFAPDPSKFVPDSSVYAIARPPRAGTEGQVPPHVVGGTIVSTVSTSKRRGAAESSEKAPPPPIEHVVPSQAKVSAEPVEPVEHDDPPVETVTPAVEPVEATPEPELELIPVPVAPPAAPRHDTAPRVRLVHDTAPRVRLVHNAAPAYPVYDTAPRTRPVAVPPLPPEPSPRVPSESADQSVEAIGSLLGEIGGLPKVEVRAAYASPISDPPTEPNDRARRSYELRSRELERAAQERLVREQQRIERGIREQLAHDKRELEMVLDNRLDETVVRPSQLKPYVAPTYNDDLDWDGPADS
ncbi:MAG TPA: polysaccharide biosynthesis tyrosine autokinase [Pseudolysinimonas sp.]|nr:polysaccharide biosynthesis tyrosine autokinase [Pseudolysinimonas sp.]